MARRGIQLRRIPAARGLLLLVGLFGLACGGTDENADRPAAAGGKDPAAVLEATAPREHRLVSLSPIATRFLVALGVGARLVAVDEASRALPGLAGLPLASLAEVPAFDADLVFVPALPGAGAQLASLAATGIRFVEFAPHDLEDVFTLCRGVGRELVGQEAAERLERQIARPLALIAGKSPPHDRPRVVALVRIEPPELAGGHSFETDLIEIAGGTSLTHGDEDVRRPIDAEGLARLDPDLVLVMTPRAPTPAEQDRATRLAGARAKVVAFPFERETFWLDEPARDAARLHDLIAGRKRS